MIRTAPAARATPPPADRRRSRWFRLSLWLHRWTSVVATIPFCILCLTGTVLIFHNEIDTALGITPAAQAGESRVAACLQTLAREVPDQRVLSLGVDPIGHPGVLLAVVADPKETGFNHARLIYFNLATGQRLQGDEDPDHTFTGFLLKLHAEWFLGPAGRLLGAFIGLLVIVSLLSSLVIYAPYMKKLAFGTIRRTRGARLTQLDLHNLVGAVVIGWALTVSVTGFLIGFSDVAVIAWQLTDLAKVRQEFASTPAVDVRHPPVSADRAIEAALARTPPGWGLSSVIFPGTDYTTPGHYGVLTMGSTGLDARRVNATLVDATTGQVTRQLALPAYLQAVFVSEPLHFGDYGGLPLKLLWTTCSLLTLFIVGNGAWLFFDRRRSRTLAREDLDEVA
jgi:uncharacterized iron-regulated membrane protein